MFITIINDCKDDNAKGRQETRIQSLTGLPVSYVAVDSDLHAGMQLIDMLDAAEGRKGLILLNCAPRGGSGKQFPNGTPFGYFRVGETIVVTTIAGFALSAVKHFGIAKDIALLDTKEATDALHESGVIPAEETAYIPESQFRSFDFSPRVGIHLLEGNEVPHTVCSLEDVPDLPKVIWHIDSFGNCKTTLTPEEVKTDESNQTRFGELPYYPHLHDVPVDDTAMIRGSSGYKNTRLIELTIQGISFKNTHGAKIGDGIFTEENFGESAT